MARKITRAKAPSSPMDQWSVSRKQGLVMNIEGGRISRQEAAARFGLSDADVDYLMQAYRSHAA